MGKCRKMYKEFDTDRAEGCIRDIEHAYLNDGGIAVLYGNIAPDGCIVKTAGVPEEIAREALRLASHKLPIKCKIVTKEETAPETENGGEAE